MDSHSLTTFGQHLAPIILLIFLVVTTVESVIDLLFNRRLYELNDTLQNLSMFFINRIAGGLAGSYLFVVLSVGEHLVPWKLGVNWYSFAVTFLIVDFLYYIQHYCFHKHEWLVAFHSVHHTSEQYNFTTALRANIFLPVINPLFYLPAVVMGCDALTIAIAFAIIQTYQFLLHTQLVGKLGPIEGLFNTPSAHRVHHGNKPEQFHSNLGGVLMIWDKLSQTYMAENDKIVFGSEGQPPGNLWHEQIGPFVPLIRSRIVGKDGIASD